MALQRIARLALALTLAALAAGCASTAENKADPWEGLNRKTHAFNTALDDVVLKPTATAYTKVVPSFAREGVNNFFDNLEDLNTGIQNILQGKPKEGFSDLGRLLVNSTLGVFGLWDVATPMGLEKHNEDFGQTLGVWGVPGGPYLVLPLLGPSNPRDTGGLVVDYGLNGYTWFIPWYASAGVTSVRIVNQRSRLLETIREERKAAFDFYVAVRNAYVQRRENQVADRQPKSEESDDDLYNLFIDDAQ